MFGFRLAQVGATPPDPLPHSEGSPPQTLGQGGLGGGREVWGGGLPKSFFGDAPTEIETKNLAPTLS